MDIRITLKADLKQGKICATIEDIDNEKKDITVKLKISGYGNLADKIVACSDAEQELVWDDTPSSGKTHSITSIAYYKGSQQDSDNKLIHL